MNSSTKTLTRTGLAVALVVAAQFLGKLFPAGAVIFGPFSLNQLITGSLVNLILIVSAAVIGLWPAAAVGVLSSVLATLIGVGPIFPIITPAIAAGNCVIVAMTALLSRDGVLKIPAILAGAAAKCAFLWISVPLLFQFIPEIKPPQAQMLSIMFSWPQFITAAVGGTLAMLILPALQRALGSDAV